MKNIFFILFVVACIIYCYGHIGNNETLKNIGVFSLAPSLLIHYILNTKKIKALYILVIVFSFFGDTSFHLENNIAREPLTILSYIFLIFFMTLIVLERIEFKELRRTAYLTGIILVVLLAINYSIFKNEKYLILTTAVYFIALSVLSALCISFYKKTKSKEAGYYLLGTIAFVLASITKSLEYLDQLKPVSIILNVSFYIITFYFYSKAILVMNKPADSLSSSNSIKF